MHHVAEIVRDVVEARAELYRAAGERDAERGEPDESVTPASLASGEHEEDRESPHTHTHVTTQYTSDAERCEPYESASPTSLATVEHEDDRNTHTHTRVHTPPLTHTYTHRTQYRRDV